MGESGGVDFSKKAERGGGEEGRKREEIVLVPVSAIYKRNEGKRRGSRAGLNTARPHAEGQTSPPVSQLLERGPFLPHNPQSTFPTPQQTLHNPSASCCQCLPSLPPIRRIPLALCSPSARPPRDTFPPFDSHGQRRSRGRPATQRYSFLACNTYLLLSASRCAATRRPPSEQSRAE